MAIRNEFLETLSSEPPQGWTRGHVTLHLQHPDEKVCVEAWLRGAFAVHESKSGANLTHSPTGLRIWTCDGMNSAVRLAETIEPLAEWTAIKERCPSGSDLYPKVREAVNKLAL